VRLLIIEHHAGLRQLVRRWVEGFDSVICECVSAEEALALGPDLRPDWVLLDAQLKPGNGLAALRDLKSRFGAARFVLVSDFDDETLRRAALQAGACACLPKEDLTGLRSLILREGVQGPPIRTAAKPITQTTQPI
jgi:DNA-binding NarL/FixJ family response regulator